MSAFATVQELEAYWRPLTSEEQTRAGALLESSSNRLRLMYRPADLDEKVSDDALYEEAVKSVVMESVKRAMTTPINLPATDSYSQTAGPYSENYKFSNPSGDMYFKKSELKLLGINSNILRSISTSRTDIYSDPSEV